MKVEFSETVEVTGTATIDIEDIHGALLEAMSNVDIELTRGGANERQKAFVLNTFANTIYQCLEAITDDMISEGSDALRKAFSEALLKHGARWSKSKQ